MLPWLLHILQGLNDPKAVVLFACVFVAAYYVASALFIHFKNQPSYAGIWRHDGPIDFITSTFWMLMAVFMIISLIDLVVRNKLPLTYLFIYYMLFIFLFAFLYNVLEWHWPGVLAGVRGGWGTEFDCLIISIGAITTGGFMRARPAKWQTELLASIEQLLGLFFVAVFVAQAVSLTPRIH